MIKGILGIIACVIAIGALMMFLWTIAHSADVRDQQAKDAIANQIHGLQVQIDTLHAEAIRRGYAQYNQTNGQWNWK